MNDTKLTKKRRFTPLAIIFGIVLLVYSVSLIFLLTWGILSSARDRLYFQQYPLTMPWDSNFQPRLKNYVEAFTNLKFTIGSGEEVRLPLMFFWTILYSLGTCCVAQFTRCACGYICAKYNKYRITRILYNIAIVVMILPIIGATASSITVHKMLGTYDNIFLYILTSAGFTGQYFLIYYASFKGVSWGYAEAAFMDGANHFLVFFKIMLPLVRNVMGALFLLEFIGLWNDYTVIVTYLPSYPTVSYGLYIFSISGRAGNTTLKLAASIMVCIPILILYIVFNKKLLGNVSIGGLKG